MANFVNNYNYLNNSENKETLIDEIKKLFSIAVEQHTSEDDNEKQWLLQNSKSPVISEVLQEISCIGLHILDAVGQFEPVNSITISKKTGIPKGTVSKIINKLILNDLIIKTPLPDNKKEFLFYITPLGKELYELHKALHIQIESGITNFLKKYNAEELQFIIRLLKDFSRVKWSNIESL